MFSRTLPLGRVRGIHVRLSPSLPLFALVVLWAFAARFAPGHGYAVAFAMGAAGMVLFFGSILVHELGHALEARHRDLEVVGITLSMFGGVTEMHAERQTARDELAVAAIGPYLSLLCAAVFGLIATFGPDLLSPPAGTVIAEVAGLLGWVNVALAVFNLIPGAPLDGGRVLRAALWAVLRDRQRAIVSAARFGQLLWAALVAVSVWGYIARAELRLTAGLGVVVGLFLFDAARREIANARLDALYADHTVGDLVGQPAEPVDVSRSIQELAAQHLSDDENGTTTAGAVDDVGARLVLVVDRGEPIGYLDVAAVAADRAGSTDAGAAGPGDAATSVDTGHATTAAPPSPTAGDLARPLDGLPRVDTRDDLHGLVDRFQGDTAVVIVERDGRPIAAVTEREAAQAIGALRRRRGGSATQRRVDRQPVGGP